MQLISVLAASIFALTAAGTALPIPARFRIKAETTSPSGKFNGLELIAFHTGAGTNAAVFTEGPGDVAYINGSALYFSLGKGPDTQYPMQFEELDLSDGWGYTSINIINGPEKGFTFNSDGYLTNKNYEIVKYGWRVCLWNHLYPELFWNNIESDDNADEKVLPSNCALVKLKPVFV